MSDGDLRDKLTTALTECSGADIEEDDLDALMPVIREALADAWDDGWGIGYRSDGYDSGTSREREFTAVRLPWIKKATTTREKDCNV